MIKRETTILLMNTAVGIGVITILSFFVIWLGFPAETPKESFKDALGFSGSLFGGLTTFGAAIVAAHLFNDWKEQHDKTIAAGICIDILNFSTISNFKLLQILNLIEKYLINNDNTHQDAIKDLIQIQENLQTMRGEVVAILIPKTHLIVTETDYKDIFQPIFEQIIFKIGLYILTMNRCSEGLIYKENPTNAILIKDLKENIIELTNLMNTIPAKLRPYYKALT